MGLFKKTQPDEEYYINNFIETLVDNECIQCDMSDRWNLKYILDIGKLREIYYDNIKIIDDKHKGKTYNAIVYEYNPLNTKNQFMKRLRTIRYFSFEKLDEDFRNKNIIQLDTNWYYIIEKSKLDDYNYRVIVKDVAYYE